MEKETTKCDGDFIEIAATVERGEGDKTVVRRQVQESEKLVQQLKRQIQQLEPGRGSGVDDRRRRPSNYPCKHAARCGLFELWRTRTFEEKLSIEEEEFSGFSGCKFHLND